MNTKVLLPIFETYLSQPAEEDPACDRYLIHLTFGAAYKLFSFYFVSAEFVSAW